MTNYNDGKWHVTPGFECPVNKRSQVECLYTDRKAITSPAGDFPWGTTSADRPIAFRVIREHVEPREVWFRQGILSGEWHECLAAADGAVLFREVQP